MKKLFLIFTLLSTVTFCTTAQEIKSKVENPYSQLGFVSQLVFNKSITEMMMTAIMNDSTIYFKENKKVTPEEAAQRRASNRQIDLMYNSIKIKTDQLLLQVIADMRRHNDKRLYKVIDNAFKDDGDVNGLKDSRRHYKKIISEIHADIQKLYDFYNSLSGQKAFLAEETFLGIGEQVIGIITTASENRDRKIGHLAAILDALRLAQISDLGKSEEKDE